MTNGGQLEDWQRQALMTEYQTCQSHNNSLNSQSWFSFSILITVNLLVLGQVISELVFKSAPTNGWANFILTLLISFVMILILCIFFRWHERVKFQVWVNNHRMQEIEESYEYVIWKNWRIRGLDRYYEQKDEFNKRYPTLKDKVKNLSKEFPKIDYTILSWLKEFCGFCFKSKEKKSREMEYKPPTTKGLLKFNCIFTLLITLWAILIILEFLIFFCQNCRLFLLN